MDKPIASTHDGHPFWQLVLGTAFDLVEIRRPAIFFPQDQKSKQTHFIEKHRKFQIRINATPRAQVLQNEMDD